LEFDKTTVVIRERSQVDILDLSLHLCRTYAWPLLVAMALGAAPFAVINALLLNWMLDIDRQDYTSWESFIRALRYVWLMALLVFIQAPLASVFATAYLGRAVFQKPPRVREIVREVFVYAPHLLWNQVLLRGVAPAMLVALAISREPEFQPGLEIILMGGLAGYAALIRSLRPFMNEIILLEKNPLRSANASVVTVGRRSAYLHGPSTGDLFSRWVGAATIAILLTACVYGAIRFISGVMLNDWWEGIFPGGWRVSVGLPLAMWLVAAYFAAARYLSYLDLRIRHEGWEVELRLRAEAARLNERLTKAS
jgi:hypothetical protein